MANIRVDHVARSLAVTAYLVLKDLDPWMDYDEVTNGPDGRPRITYPDDPPNQDMDVVYGPYGEVKVPGVVVEYGTAVVDRGRCRLPIVLSIARLIDISIEVAQDDMNFLAEKLRKLVFDTKSAPIYGFVSNEDTINDPIGTLLWTEQSLRGLPLPTETPVGNQEIGGWLRFEFRFTVHYNRTFSTE